LCSLRVLLLLLRMFSLAFESESNSQFEFDQFSSLLSSRDAMLASSSAYKNRLVRMKTVSSDCRKYRRSVLLSDSPFSIGEPQKSSSPYDSCQKAEKLRPLRTKESSASMLDLQTNNSRREGAVRPRVFQRAVSVSGTGGTSDLSQMHECLSKSLTSLKKREKLKVQYEEPEDEPEEIEETDYALIDEYEKSFAYARRLRALLNMKFKVVDRSSIETKLSHVKAHEHPTQRVLDRWRNVDLGQPFVRKKLIDDFKQTCGQKKKPKKGEVRIPIYPDWIRFTFRFKKDASEKRWADFCAYKQRMKKLAGGQGTVPKANDKYLPAYYDIWSTSITVFAKPETTVLNMVDPVFSKLGLDSRADFRFTLGCFEGDKRAGKAKIQGAPAVPEEVAMQSLCGDLYKRNCAEIFVNDNRIEMFKAFPEFLQQQRWRSKEDKKAKKDKKGGKNQSNLASTNALSVTTDEVDSADNDGARRKEQILMARLSMVRQHLRPRTLAAAASAAAAKAPTVGSIRRAATTRPTQPRPSTPGAAFSSGAATTSKEEEENRRVRPAPREDNANKEQPPAFTSRSPPELDDPLGDDDFDEVDFDSSPSATNQNLSIHDCDSSLIRHCVTDPIDNV
uniref:AAA domain-containing protein n=1 Tax=Macrostomum lignano TaxID=282301 RepID=A0A1I8I0V1_9PLAT